MATKKIDIINGAFSQMRISGLTVDPGPEDVAVALDRLEDMASEWLSRNVNVGYYFEDDPDPDSIFGVDRAYKQAFETNLAVNLIPDFNKDVPQVLFARATASYSTMSSSIAQVCETQYPSRMPRGSGNTFRYNRWRRFYPGRG